MADMKEKQATRRLTAFIVDDESGPLDVLANDLKLQPEIKDVYAFSSYQEATLPLIELQPDVVFLDIEVPGKSGLEFLQSIRPRIAFSFHAVFYTGHSHYMLDAIRHSAFDFLLKPYKTEELRAIIDRLTAAPSLFPACNERLGRHCDASTNKIALQTISELLLVAVEEVLVIQYDRNTRSWQLTLTNGNTHRLHAGSTATELLTMSPVFVQINSGCIVNLNYLAAVENSTQRCRLCHPYEKMELVASRRYYSRLKERFELL